MIAMDMDQGETSIEHPATRGVLQPSRLMPRGARHGGSHRGSVSLAQCSLRKEDLRFEGQGQQGQARTLSPPTSLCLREEG